MKYLILDVHNLAWMSSFTLQGLSIDVQQTGVIYGVLNQILSLQKKFNPDGFLCCFDSRKSHRRRIYPDYKKPRIEKTRTPKEEQLRKITIEQINQLRTYVLPTLGFGNIYHKTGFEADDLIAELCQFESDFIIISTDEDLYQLLTPKKISEDKKAVRTIYNIRNKKVISKDDFREKYRITPDKWYKVKALAGCHSDNVPGMLRGIGEKTAIRFINGDRKTKKLKELDDYLQTEEGKQKYNCNVKLVKLPLKPLDLSIAFDNFSKESFIDVFDRFRFNHFLKNFDEWERNFGLI